MSHKVAFAARIANLDKFCGWLDNRKIEFKRNAKLRLWGDKVYEAQVTMKIPGLRYDMGVICNQLQGESMDMDKPECKSFQADVAGYIKDEGIDTLRTAGFALSSVSETEDEYVVEMEVPDNG